MNDTLDYIKQDPIFRRYHHRLLTFSLLYAFSENYILPFSHDEVVHMKGSMLGKVPGDDWQKAATLRALYGYMYAHPGKKLMFMGCEFGQGREWSHDRSLDWHLLEQPLHDGLRRFVRDLNRVYASEPALHQCDFEPPGFQWIDCNDSDNSVVSLMRRATATRTTSSSRSSTSRRCRATATSSACRARGSYTELLNSDAARLRRQQRRQRRRGVTEPVASHGYAQSLRLTLPPLGFLLLKPSSS